ncbi:MAG: tetratricopeptide repeat protein [Acidobacteriota bacterium]
MNSAINQHPLIRAYISSSAAWKQQTYEQWHLAAGEFEVFYHQQGGGRELAAAQAFCAAQAARKMELYEQAVKSYQEASELLPDWPLVPEALAAAYYHLGRYSEATEQISSALKLDSTLIQARLTYAEILCVRNNYRAAEDVLTLGLKHHPGDLGLHCFLGHIALSDRCLDAAERHYQHALTLSPEYSDAHTGMSSVRLLQQRYEDALDHIKLALDQNQRDSAALINRGFIYYTYNQPTEAEADFERAIRFAPRAAQNYFRLATFYWQRQDLNKAERYLRLAINCESYRSHYHSVFALLLMEKGQMAYAEQYFHQALLLNPEDIIALHGLAVLALISEDPQSSEQFLTRAAPLLTGGKRTLLTKLAARLHPKLRSRVDVQL